MRNGLWLAYPYAAKEGVPAAAAPLAAPPPPPPPAAAAAVCARTDAEQAPATVAPPPPPAPPNTRARLAASANFKSWSCASVGCRVFKNWCRCSRNRSCLRTPARSLAARSRIMRRNPSSSSRHGSSPGASTTARAKRASDTAEAEEAEEEADEEAEEKDDFKLMIGFSTRFFAGSPSSCCSSSWSSWSLSATRNPSSRSAPVRTCTRTVSAAAAAAAAGGEGDEKKKD